MPWIPDRCSLTGIATSTRLKLGTSGVIIITLRALCHVVFDRCPESALVGRMTELAQLLEAALQLLVQ